MELSELIREMSERNNKDLDIASVNEIYLDFVKSNRRYGTYEHHRDHLKAITNYLKLQNVKMVSEIEMKVIYKFNRTQKDSGVTNKTINKRIQVLKRAISLSIELGYLSKNPLEKVDKLRETTTETQIIPTYIYTKIFDYLDTNPDEFAQRDKVILYLFLETGIRVSEVVELNVEDFNFEERYIHLKFTKTSEERILYFTTYVKYELLNYMENYNISTGPFFLSRYHERITKNAISIRLQRIKEHLDIKLSISPHKWRHTCATYSLSNGANVEEVKKMLGHKHLETTNKYVHVRNEIVIEMVNQASPVKKMKLDEF
ncbi:MAG: tyrosine-type recombinase/integrase [Bacilli bacterium]|nr:tyrosine-type recombinase/integrase [Bacilli bacterium]